MQDFTATKTAISVKNVCHQFDGKQTLKNITFEVNPGEIFVIMGPSGSGKTLLLKHIVGLLRPSKGKILVGEKEAGSQELKDQTRIALVFQNGGLLNSLSVMDNVGLYLYEHRLKKGREIRQIVSERLKSLGISDSDASKYPFELSGGMIKRVAIARAMVMQPDVILYDEPTSELDPIMAKTVTGEIRRMHDNYRQTTIIVTHDRSLACNLADRIGILINGELLASGTPEEIKNCTNPEVHNFLSC